MVGPIRYHKSDPNASSGFRRGPGWYYHRGRGYYSRKDDMLDKRRGGKVGTGIYRHTSDRISKKARALGTVRPRTPDLPTRVPSFMQGAKKGFKKRQKK
jgi:hypothetical protein